MPSTPATSGQTRSAGASRPASFPHDWA